MRKVFVAIPALDWKAYLPTVHTVVQAQAEAFSLGIGFELQSLLGDSDLTRARNVLLGQFRSSDCSHMLCLDADVSGGPGTFSRIMAHEADVVCGAYRLKTDQGEYYPVHWSNPRRMEIDPGSKAPLLAADLAPAGFLRLSRSCVETLCAQVGKEDWFVDARFPGVEIPDVFEWTKDRVKRSRLSEDYSFCRKWQATGGTVWVDPTLRLDHSGTKTFEGDLYASLAREAEHHRARTMDGATIVEMAKAALTS